MTFTKKRFQKLARILTESIHMVAEVEEEPASNGEEESLASKATVVVAAWVKTNEEKIDKYIEQDITQWYESGENVDADEDGTYNVPVPYERYDGKSLFATFADEALEGLAEEDWNELDRWWSNKTTKKLEQSPIMQAIWKPFEDYSRTAVEDIANNVKMDLEDRASYDADPYAYYGVRRSDF